MYAINYKFWNLQIFLELIISDNWNLNKHRKNFHDKAISDLGIYISIKIKNLLRIELLH